MLYLLQIETTERTDFPAWQAVHTATEPEEYNGTAAAYGRLALYDWLDDNEYVDGQTISYVDDNGLSTVRVRVAFGEDPDAFASDSNVVAVVDCNGLDSPPKELADLEKAREHKLYIGLLDLLADEQLSAALTAAKATGRHSKNWLADYVHPAVSRPVALKMTKDTTQPAARAARPYKLRRASEPRTHDFGSAQPEATYELVIGGKVAALINKYIDRKNQKTRGGRVKFIPVTYWTFELEHGVSDDLGYDTRDEAVKHALKMLKQEKS